MLERAVRPWAEAFKTKAEEDGERTLANACATLIIYTGSGILEQFAVL